MDTRSDTPEGREHTEHVRPLTYGHTVAGLEGTHLLKSAEVQAILHLPKTTLHDYRVAGRIRAFRHHPRGNWFYPADQPILQAVLGRTAAL